MNKNVVEESTILRGEPLIRVQGVSKVFSLRNQEVHALRDISLDIMCGEYLSIMGPSGSGKSTLFNMIGALDIPTSGSVRIGPLDLTALTSRQLAFVRNNYIGYVFQMYNLIPSLTAVKNVALPRLLGGSFGREADRAAEAALEKVGLADRLHHRPDELSGGQQQRVAVARALVNEPEIVLADEPTANLDSPTGAQIIALLKELSTNLDVTVITATHDHKMLSNSDRVLWIVDGVVDRIDRREDLHIDEGTVMTADQSDAGA